MLRIVLAGCAGGIATNLAMLLTFRLIGFGWNGDGFLITSAIQSPKLIAVWTKLEPPPMVVTHPAPSHGEGDFAISMSADTLARKVFTHGVIPGSSHTQALGISFPGIDEVHLIGPRNHGEPQWSTMSDWTCR